MGFSFPSVTRLCSCALLFSSQWLYPSLGLLYPAREGTTVGIAFFLKYKNFFLFWFKSIWWFLLQSTTHCVTKGKLLNLSESVSSAVKTSKCFREGEISKHMWSIQHSAWHIESGQSFFYFFYFWKFGKWRKLHREKISPKLLLVWDN